MSNKQTTVAPAEQASKQVPTEQAKERAGLEIDGTFNQLLASYRAAAGDKQRKASRKRLIAYIEQFFGVVGQPAAPVAATEQATDDTPRTELYDTPRAKLYLAAIDCGHMIEEDKIVLYRDESKESNALGQLGDRLDAALSKLIATPADAGAAILAGKVPKGRSVIEMLRRAMDQAGVQGAVRGMLVGYFGNEWNKSTGTASAGDFAEYWNSLEHDCEGAELARCQHIAQRAWSAAQAAIPAEPHCADIGALVSRFLAWPLPASVSARLAPNVTFPIGTHIMSADEAKAMFAHCLARLSTPAAPVTAEPASWILQARSPEGDPWQNITPEQYSAANAAGYETRMVPAAPQPAAQVPSIDRDSVLEEAAEACMRATPDRAHVRRIGEAAHYTACRDAIRALKGQPAAAHAANEGGAK